MFDLIFSKISCLKGDDITKYHRDGLVVWFATFQTRVTRFGPKWARLTQMGHIRDFFSSKFNTFWLGKRKCTEMWFEKVQDLSHLGPIWTILDPNLTSLFQTTHYTLHAQTHLQSLLWAVLISVTRLVAHSTSLLLNEGGNIYTNLFHYS